MSEPSFGAASSFFFPQPLDNAEPMAYLGHMAKKILIDDTVHQASKVVAAEQGVTLTEFVTNAVTIALHNYRPKRRKPPKNGKK